MAFKELDTKMKELVNSYLNCVIAYLKGDRAFDNLTKIVNFSNAFYSLTEKERRFVENEYIANSNNGWRNKNYSKSTYYNLKSGIVKKFLKNYETKNTQNNQKDITVNF